jgi:hypothetical protein
VVQSCLIAVGVFSLFLTVAVVGAHQFLKFALIFVLIWGPNLYRNRLGNPAFSLQSSPFCEQERQVSQA